MIEHFVYLKNKWIAIKSVKYYIKKYDIVSYKNKVNGTMTYFKLVGIEKEFNCHGYMYNDCYKFSSFSWLNKTLR